MKCTRDEDRCFRCGAEHKCLILTSAPLRQPCSFFKPNRFDYDTTFIRIEKNGVWKCIRGWEGLYMINNFGEVVGPTGKTVAHEYERGRVLVTLRYKTQRCQEYVDELVADAFVPGDGEIYFKDGDPHNVNAFNIGRLEK